MKSRPESDASDGSSSTERGHPERARPEPERSSSSAGSVGSDRPRPRNPKALAPSDRTGFRASLHEVIFEADTRAGKLFDLVLLVAIVLSIAAVMLESVDEFRQRHGLLLRSLEWIFTALFTIEYVLRLACVKRPLRYATSFFGLVDLLAVIPSYLSLFLPGAQSLLVVRVLRVLRIFRVLKLAHFVSEATDLMRALVSARRKIIVFLGSVLTIVVIMGTVMYLVEGGAGSGFTSIPRSVYWAIVTLTTVGYGDIAPQTTVGQAIAGAVMILGYSIIAVPTGIITAELARTTPSSIGTAACPACSLEGHDVDAKYCKFCGESL